MNNEMKLLLLQCQRGSCDNPAILCCARGSGVHSNCIERITAARHHLSLFTDWGILTFNAIKIKPALFQLYWHVSGSSRKIFGVYTCFLGIYMRLYSSWFPVRPGLTLTMSLLDILSDFIDTHFKLKTNSFQG